MTRKIADIFNDWKTQYPPLAEKYAGSRTQGRKAADALADKVLNEGDAWADARMRELETQLLAGTELDPQERMARAAESAALADQFRGQGRTVVRNRLIDPAKEYVDQELFEKARIYYDAALRLGVEDGELQVAFDKADPKKAEAVEQAQAVDEEWRRLHLQVESDKAAVFGTLEEAAAVSIAAKSHRIDLDPTVVPPHIRETGAAGRLEKSQREREPVGVPGDSRGVRFMTGDGQDGWQER